MQNYEEIRNITFKSLGIVQCSLSSYGSEVNRLISYCDTLLKAYEMACEYISGDDGTPYSEGKTKHCMEYYWKIAKESEKQ